MYFSLFHAGRNRALPLLSAALGLTFALSAHAQFRTSVQGSVTDTQGAVVPGATLTLKDNGTNAVIVRTSDDAGVFNFNALPADHFTLTVERQGFQKKVLSDLQFIPEQANALNVQLGVGDVMETVEVNASTVQALDTETANIGATVSANDIQHLPSLNRDVFTLTQLVPGAISDGSRGAGGGVYNYPGNQGPGGSGNSGAAPTENGPQANANGQAYGNNSITLDGISTVSAVWGGTTIITPTEESIDNVRIVTNDYDAENGRFSGAQTMVTSKSGTNQLHGSAFIAIHRPGLNAFNRLPQLANGTRVGSALRDTGRYNQYGGSLGGPILKNRLFAFFAYETSPNGSQATSTGWYETSAFRSAANASSVASKYLGYPGSAPAGTLVTSGINCQLAGLVEGTNCRTIAGQGLDIGSPLTNGLGRQDPTATGNAANPGVGNGLDGVADVGFYTTSTPRTSYYRQYVGRLDGDVTKKDHLAFTIYWVPQGNTGYNGGARSYNVFNHDQINQAMSVIYNHTFSPTFLNEARANVSGWRWNEITSNPQQPVGLAQANVTFAPSATLNQFGSSLGSILNQWTYGYKDVATKIAGRHTIKFGGDYTNLHYLNNPVGRPTYGFYNIWSFLNDAPYQESGPFNSVTGLPGGTRSDERENLFGGFLQDDYKVRPNLTVHAGVRYSYFGALYAKQNNLPVAQFGAGTASYTGLNVRAGSNGLWDPQKGNFGPQLGFNWSPGTFNNKLVVRGGYGLNFNQEEIAITANAGNNPPTQNYPTFQFDSPTSPGVNGPKILYSVSSNLQSLNGFPSNPNTITTYNANGLPTAGSANVIVIGDGHRGLPTTYVQHFSLDTQYEVNRELVASVGYQGSLGRHLISHMNPNAPGAVAGYALNPLVTGGDYWTNIGSSNNNALLVELKHPFVHHFSMDAQFMYAKSLDTNGSGPYYEDPYLPLNAAYTYGPSDFNVGKSIKVFGLWQPVLFKGDHGWLEKVAGGWSLSGIFNLHTGFPYSPTYGLGRSLYCSQCGYYNVRPSYLGGGNGDRSNDAFINNSNFPGYSAPANAAVTTSAPVNDTTCVSGSANYPGCLTITSFRNRFFNVPNFASAIQATNGTGFPSANVALPSAPGLGRNAFVGPGYRNVDASLTKGFGIPNTRILGEGARFEIRADVFNLFNILNLNPQSVAANVNASNFGQDTSVLGGRVVTLQGRFSF